ncbi:MAG: hypothetical protein JSS02_31190 [Planctomycetes bacterium]|nr:hypothetical protein [Planctomycetota bacterium]
MLQEPDWSHSKNRIIEHAHAAVVDFADQHPDVECSAFALAADFLYGDLFICFDTIENSLREARRHALDSATELSRVVRGEIVRNSLVDVIKKNNVRMHCSSSSEFAFPRYRLLHFTEWEAFFGDDDLPEEYDCNEPVIRLLVDAYDKLLDSRVFNRLKLSSPFYLCLDSAGELKLSVIHILNWPMNSESNARVPGR